MRDQQDLVVAAFLDLGNLVEVHDGRLHALGYERPQARAAAADVRPLHLGEIAAALQKSADDHHLRDIALRVDAHGHVRFLHVLPALDEVGIHDDDERRVQVKVADHDEIVAGLAAVQQQYRLGHADIAGAARDGLRDVPHALEALHLHLKPELRAFVGDAIGRRAVNAEHESQVDAFDRICGGGSAGKSGGARGERHAGDKTDRVAARHRVLGHLRSSSLARFNRTAAGAPRTTARCGVRSTSAFR